MNKILPFLKIMLVLIISSFMLEQAAAQALLTENFDYPNGTLLTNSGWAAHSGTGSQPVDVSVPGLTFAGYPLSNIGGAALLDNTGEDVNKTFASQTTGAVYCAFMVKVEVVSDGYFLHLGQTSMGTTFFGRVWVVGSGSNFKFGLTRASETPAIVTSEEYNKGNTYLVVLKYNIIDGANNDEVSLYVINSAVPSTEPSTASIPPFTASTSEYSPGSIGLRQYNASQKILVDGIRIAKNWADAVTAPAGSDTNPPVFASGYPKVANVDAAKADLQVSLDEAGKVYYLVVPDGSATPTTAQVIAGTNYGSVTKVAGGSIDVDAGGSVKSATITSLVDKTNYDIWVVAQDDEATPNKQANPVLVNLYTIAPPKVIFSSKFPTSISPFIQVSLKGDAVWGMYTTADIQCPQISGYVNSTYQENLDYLISPSIDISGYENVKMSFLSAKNYTGPALKVLISTGSIGWIASTVSSTLWTDITSNFTFSTGSFTFVPSGEFNLSGYTSPVNIAFVYESTTSQAATWEVDDVLVTGYEKKTGVPAFQAGDITVYPIPADNKVFLRNVSDVSSVEIFDLNGRKQFSEVCNGVATLQLNIGHLTKGIYLIRFNKTGVPVVKKIIKE